MEGNYNCSLILFLKGYFIAYFRCFQTNITIFTPIYVKNVHPLSGTGIRTHIPLGRESSPITIRPELPSSVFASSVTRFGEISPLWQKVYKSLAIFWQFISYLSILRQVYDIIGLIFLVANGQLLRNNLTIWSHCLQAKHLCTIFCFMLDDGHGECMIEYELEAPIGVIMHG